MSEQPREVEGVLLVSADDQEGAGRRVGALERVDRFELRPRPTQRIRDVYLDTGDGALAGARVAFRVRELDGRPLLTLKANPVRSGLAAERLELEAPWSAEALQSMLEELRRHGVQLPDAPGGGGAGEPLADLAGLGLHPTQTATPPAPRATCTSGAGTAGRSPSSPSTTSPTSSPPAPPACSRSRSRPRGRRAGDRAGAAGGPGRGVPRRPAALALRQAGHRPGRGAAAGRGRLEGLLDPSGQDQPSRPRPAGRISRAK